jgi:hypothetical protein
MATLMVNNTFIYDDNFLSEKEIQEIEDLFNSNSNKWMYSEVSIQSDHQEYETIVSSEQFGDSQYFVLYPEHQDNAYKLCEKVINRFTEKHKVKYNQLLRVKLNMTPSGAGPIVTYPHIDDTNPHYIFLYYVNDSQGDTIIYNETYNGSKIDDVSVMTRISPKRGSAFIIDGRHFHSLTVPNNGDLRRVINANLFYI